MGASTTQRPDLFRTAVVGVGVLEMLRFHRFTSGALWINEFGSPELPAEAAWLLAYSPYHQVHEGVTYPATLVITNDHDNRVVPMHSYKFVAKLLEGHNAHPTILKVGQGAGHASGVGHIETIREEARILSFLMKELGFPLRERLCHGPGPASTP